MNHESMRERIALRTYGELDGTEAALLDAHLAECLDCRRYVEAFGVGLGRLAAEARTTSDDLPRGWSERLRAATREQRGGFRLRPWWTAAAGFAAGVLATIAIARGPAPAAGAKRGTAWDRFHGEAPPPFATTEGRVRELGEYLRK